MLDALQLGYQVSVVMDGCRGVNIQPDDSQLAFNQMQQRGAVLVDSVTMLKSDK